MRAAVLLVAVLTAGCAQSDKRKAIDSPVVMETPKLSTRIRAHDQERAAPDSTASTTVDGAVLR